MNQDNPERQIVIGGKRLRWRVPPSNRKGGTGLGGLIHVVLMIAALVDLRRRPAEQINGSKRLWMFLVFIYWIGPISYFVIGRKRTTSQTSNELAAPAVAGL